MMCGRDHVVGLNVAPRLSSAITWSASSPILRAPTVGGFILPRRRDTEHHHAALGAETGPSATNLALGRRHLQYSREEQRIRRAGLPALWHVPLFTARSLADRVAPLRAHPVRVTRLPATAAQHASDGQAEKGKSLVGPTRFSPCFDTPRVYSTLVKVSRHWRGPQGRSSQGITAANPSLNSAAAPVSWVEPHRHAKPHACWPLWVV